MFLYLHQAYYSLYHGRCLEILAAYYIGPREFRIPKQYWDQIFMVAQSNVYFGGAFKAQRGVTHSNPLSPTIFNIVVDVVDVVDVVLRHWVSVVEEAEGEAGLGVFFRDVQLMVAYF